MYETLRHHSFSAQNANVVHTMVRECRSAAQVGSLTIPNCPLQLLRVEVPLGFLPIDILEPLPSTMLARQPFFVMTDGYSKLTCAIPKYLIGAFSDYIPRQLDSPV